jgi:hypothetical protein
VDGQKNDLRLGARRLQVPGRLEAVVHRHRDVQHQDVGLEAGNFAEQGLPVADGLDHLELRLEESGGDREEALVVVGQQHANSAHGPLRVRLGRKGQAGTRGAARASGRGSLHQTLTSLCLEGYWQK